MNWKDRDPILGVAKCRLEQGNHCSFLRWPVQCSTALSEWSGTAVRSCSAMNRRTVSRRYLTLALSFIHSGGCPARLLRRIVATETFRSLATSFSVSRGSILGCGDSTDALFPARRVDVRRLFFLCGLAASRLRFDPCGQLSERVSDKLSVYLPPGRPYAPFPPGTKCFSFRPEESSYKPFISVVGGRVWFPPERSGLSRFHGFEVTARRRAHLNQSSGISEVFWLKDF